MELPKVYDPKSIESSCYDLWRSSGAFNADPDGHERSYCIVIPPPNVTARLHLGHALNNTLQDVLIRCRRMGGFNTLWMPGTDHAGIATQTVVEKRILAQEGKRRTDFAREEFVQRVQQWKDEYEAAIIEQLELMGCSCDWRRTRFTMDEVCAAAVREAFFRLFSDGLIYRGKRLVNWDPATQTVLADDEVEHEQVHGQFWYLMYPLEPLEGAVQGGMDQCGTGVSPVRRTDVPSVQDTGQPGQGTDECGTGVSPVRRTDVPSVQDEGQLRQGAYLPHMTKPGSIYSVTFRLADSLPASVLNSWKVEREDILKRAEAQGRPLSKAEQKELCELHSVRVERYLDLGRGECHLTRPEVAEVVCGALKHFDGERYDLLAWCIMPNHVHVVVRPCESYTLEGILQSWKSYTAKQANEMLGRQGQFWQTEYYDHLIRDEQDLANAINYVLSNPANASLVDWPWAGRSMQGQDAPATHGRDARATSEAHPCDGWNKGDAPADEPRRQDAGCAREYVVVATTRPETMLGDTAVAMNPADPRARQLVGRKVRLPIVGRLIPIIADEHVVMPDPHSDDEKARYSTGFLKVTPAHDVDDYAIRERHNAAHPDSPIDIINVLAPDATISERHGWSDWQAIQNSDVENLLGMDRFEAREAVVEYFRQENLLAEVRPYTHQVGHSYRSHVPIEPYLSDQWYVAVKKPLPDTPHAGVVEGTDVPANSLAGLALAPLVDGRVKFVPQRYAANYRNWLENLRDWPISRQLWWGHQIPVWSQELDLPADVPPGPADGRDCDARAVAAIDRAIGGEFGKVMANCGVRYFLRVEAHPEDDRKIRTWICLDRDDAGAVAAIEHGGWRRDPDVLDTWFSSALWPFSTLGWPGETGEMKTFYPGDVLCTAREIITLWVSRMVMMGQYCCGDIPFHTVFIHAMIQDGEGRKMSKSLGNGIDPLDIIDSHGADAMRYTLVSMTTQTQDVRMPVQEMKLPDGRTVNTSPKFDVGRNFCNKLWNASRFAMMNLKGLPAWDVVHVHQNLADAWILSRLNDTIRDATMAVESFRFNELADTLYHFVWDDYCDWYLEIAKARINSGDDSAKAVLAHCLDVILRLLHPVAPFITEAIWGNLNDVAPSRGPGDQPGEAMLATARWPAADAAAIHPAAEQRFGTLQDLIRQVRNARSLHNVPPGQRADLVIEAGAELAATICDNVMLLKTLAQAGEVKVTAQAGEPPAGAAAVATGGVKAYVLGIVDVRAELERLTKQAEVLKKGIAGIEAKLGNEGFVSRAPADIVQRERQRLRALQADLQAVEKALAAIQ